MGLPGRRMAVSVDLDAVACYYRIHALGAPPTGPARFAILRRCLPRFAELFARHDLKATFFVVGEDLEGDAEGRALLAELARAGHASPTTPTPTATTSRACRTPRWPRRSTARTRWSPLAPGRRRLGFAPRATRSTPTRSILLRARGYRYDSSVFPSAAYYGAKALVMAAMRAAGGPRGASSTTPGCCWRHAAPTGRRRRRPTGTAATGCSRCPSPSRRSPACTSSGPASSWRLRGCGVISSRSRCGRRFSIWSCTASIWPTPEPTKFRPR